MILDRYFAWRFVRMFMTIFVVFFLITASLGVADNLRRYGGDEANFRDILNLALLDIPQSIYQILPLIMIIASIALFLGLARSSELVVTRAAGRGALRALVGPFIMALLIGGLAVAALNPIVAATSRQFEAKSDALRGESSVLTLGATGLWLRQGSANGQTVIHAGRANLDGTSLRDVTFTSFTLTGGPIQRVDAASAVLQDGHWTLRNVKIWPLTRGTTPEALATTQDRLEVPSTLTPDQIRNSFGMPSSISIWNLPAFINRLQAAGFAAQRFEVWFQMELAQPVFLAAMMLIGAAFTIRHQRGGKTGLMVLFAVMLSFTLYFIRNFAQIFGENGEVPVILAAWAPPFAALGIALGILLHREDG